MIEKLLSQPYIIQLFSYLSKPFGIYWEIRDDPCWTSRKNSLELIELSSINKVSLV
jgi:hypothetical protein